MDALGEGATDTDVAISLACVPAVVKSERSCRLRIPFRQARENGKPMFCMYVHHVHLVRVAEMKKAPSAAVCD